MCVVTVIDLDRASGDPSTPDEGVHARWRRTIAVVGLLALGAVVGGFAVLGWQTQRLRRAQESAVAVLAFPGTISWNGTATTSFPPTGDAETVVDLAGNVVIVNAGPRRINIENVFLDRPDFVLRSNNAAGWTGPGQTAEVGVSVKVSCSGGLSGATRLSVSLVTVDKQPLELPGSVPFDGGLWDDEVQRACTSS
jgi:hypothetical protein